MTTQSTQSFEAAENLKGALLMMAAMAGFVINDGFMRGLLVDIPLFQGLFLRGVILTALLIVIGHLQGSFKHKIGPRDRRIVGLRSIAEVFATFGFMTALMLIPFANLSAILQALPLAVTLAAAVFLGAPIGWRRMLAILVGFCGVLIIIRPGADGFNIGSLIALGIVGLVTIRDLASRQLSPGVPSTSVAVITSMVITGTSAIGSLFQEWAPLSPGHYGLLLGSSTALVVGYVASIATMRHGDIATVTPFRYTALIWALAIGFVFFDEKPDALTLVGAAIIVGMGIFTFYRERKLAAR